VTRTEAAPGGDLSASPSTRVGFLVFFLVTAMTLPIVLGLGMTKGLSHDEHQHVAAGALIAREGLMPYRDFPHFHTPYLACVYAGIFRFCDHLLLSARMVSVLSATGILAVIGSVAFGLFRERGRRTAALVCAGSVILALTTRLFTETSGYAWNHEPALFLALLAFVVHVAGIRANRAGWFIASGMLLGLAIGTRITYAPLVAPFGLALLLYPGPIRWDWRRVFAFSGGILFGLSGMIYLFATVPEQALYDNFGFAKTNVVYRFSTGEPRTMTLPTKLRFFWKLIVRRTQPCSWSVRFPLWQPFWLCAEHNNASSGSFASSGCCCRSCSSGRSRLRRSSTSTSIRWCRLSFSPHCMPLLPLGRSCR